VLDTFDTCSSWTPTCRRGSCRDCEALDGIWSEGLEGAEICANFKALKIKTRAQTRRVHLQSLRSIMFHRRIVLGCLLCSMIIRILITEIFEGHS
jgi:hypothetical protein